MQKILGQSLLKADRVDEIFEGSKNDKEDEQGTDKKFKGKDKFKR